MTFTCADPGGSGIAVCPPPAVVGEGAAQAISGTTTDIAGNSASAALSVSVDATPPSIVATVSPSPNAAGWLHAGATVSFTCTDAGSGIASCPAPIRVDTQGANQSFSGTATDRAGHQATATITLNVDDLPATITASVEPAPNANGWHRSDVVVTFICTESGSGIASCPAPVTVTSEGANQVVTGSAVDRAGNPSEVSVTLNIDKTPPTIAAAAAPPANAAGWHRTDVVVSFICSDSLSTIGACPPPTTVSSEGAGQVVTGVAQDRAGNTATALLTVEVDKTAPSVVIASPASDAIVTTSPVTLSGSATDTLSGIVAATCNGVPSTPGAGGALTCAPALVSGSNTLTLTATDAAGNVGKAERNITFRPNQAPTATANGPYSGTVGIAVAFNGGGVDPEGQPLTFGWSFGDGGTASGATSTHVYGATGTFTATLTVSDGQLSATSTATVVIAPVVQTNQPPTVNAGANAAITLPASASLSGVVTDDGLPINATVTSIWTKFSGPGTVTFDNAANAVTTAVFDQPGTYVLRLTASDSLLTAFSDTTITVNPAIVTPPTNQPPTVSAGTNATITLPASASLSGAVTDDGLPTGATVTSTWTRFNGPGTVTFGNSANAVTTAAFDQAGTYVLRLTASDSLLTAFSDVTITVNPAIVTPPTNQPPTVSAGTNSTITLPASASLSGAVTDDGLPIGATVTSAWTKFSGPGTVTFGNAASVATTAAFDQPGAYVLRLTASDSLLTAFSDVAITVNPAVVTPTNQPPTAAANGPYSGIAGTPVTFTGAGVDPEGQPLTFSWAFGDGGTGSGAIATHAYSAANTYTATLTVSDGQLSATSTASVVIAPIVQTNHPPTAATDGPRTGEAGIAVSFNGAGSTDPDNDVLSYAWTFGDGGTSTDQKPAHVYSAAGAFTVTLTVTDTHGAFDVATISATITAAADRAPPVVVLMGPKQALPGAHVMMSADATDNVGVTSVIFDVNGADPIEIATPPYERLVIVPDFVAPGASLKVGVTAKDAAGNSGTASATLAIVAEPDTVKPLVTMRVPSQAAPGSTLQVSATASDNAGVAAVVLAVNGITFATLTAPPYEAPYLIPAGTPVGSSVTFSAQAVDTSDNRAASSADVAIVQAADTTPPTVTLSAPATATAGTAITVTATAADDTGVASVRFFLDGTRLATVADPPYLATLTLPATLPTGTRLHVEARALDFSGLEGVASQEVDLVAPAAGVVTGEVYDDASGLPVGGASVALLGTDSRGVPYTQTSESDAHGRYAMAAAEGAGVVRISKDGWSVVNRAIVVKPNKGVTVVDARITTAAAGGAIAALSGGIVSGDRVAFLQVWQREVSAAEDPAIGRPALGGPDVLLRIPPGALASNATVTLTPLSRQALPGLLPTGWTPLAIVDIGPHDLALANAAALTSPNPLNVKAGTPVVFARWDEPVRAWRALASTVLTEDKGALAGTVDVTGQYAWIAADAVPATPPPPAAGELVAGVDAGLIPGDATAVVNPQPKILFYKPGVKSDVRGTVTTTGAPLSSGTIVRSRIVESYQFVTAGEIHPDPVEQDLVLYQIPGGPLPVMAAGFPVSPGLTFEALSLDKGVITVELRAPEEAVHEIDVIGADGGSIAGESGQRLDVKAGSVPTSVPIEVRSIPANALGAVMPAGFELVGAASISFVGTLANPAAWSIPSPAGAAAADTFFLARLQELAGQTRFVLTGIGNLANGRLVSDTALTGSAVTFEGIRTAGRYVFLRATTPVAFAAGRVTVADGTGFAGALVTSSTSALVSLSQPTGSYIALVGLGETTVTALDLQKTDTVSAPVTASAPRQVIALDLVLAARPPTVTAVTPADGAVNIALANPIIVRFSSPIDAATATLQNVRLTSSAGVVIGSLALTANNTVATFRALDPLQPNTAYTLTLSQGIADPFGRSLPAPFTATFTSLDTVAPPPPPAGSITGSIPGADGKATITATQGTAGAHDTVLVKNLTKKTVTPVILDSNGGFRVVVQAGVADKLQIVIRDASGNETVSALPNFRQVNPDGSVSESVGAEGGHVVGPAGTAVDVPAGAFPAGAVVTLKPIAEADFPFHLSADQKTLFDYVGGIALDLGGQEPIGHLNLSLTAGPNDRVEDQWFVATPAELLGEMRLNAVDTAKLIGGRITTSSPPCPGATGAALYGFVKSKRIFGVNYGLLERVPATIVAELTYPFDFAGIAIPFMSLSVQSGLSFCLPSLTGRVTVSENAVRLEPAADALTPIDRELVVKNTTRNTEVHYPRDVTEYTLTVDGGEADHYDVYLTDAAGVEKPFIAFRQNAGTAGSVAIGIKAAEVHAADRTVTIENTTRQSTFRAPVSAGRATFTVQGNVTDAYVVSITNNAGATRPVAASSYDMVSGTSGSVVVRLNADQIKVVVKTIRIANATRGSEARMPQTAAPIKLSMAGGPADTYTLTAVDTNGQSRALTFTTIVPPAPLDHGNLVVHALPFSIDPTRDEMTNGNADSDGDGFINSYERRVGTNPNDPSSSPNHDADGDSCTDVEERAKGTDPFDPNSKPAACAPAPNPAQDPANAPVQGAGRIKVELRNTTANTSFEIPAASITDGGFDYAFDGNPSDQFWVYVYYDDGQVESERIPTSRLVVRNTLTGGIVKTITSYSPAKGELVGFGTLSDDPGPPVITSGPARLDAVDPLAPLTFTFSEPINRATLTTSTFIVERNVNGTQWKAVDGTVELSADGKRATFKATTGLGLGQEYRIRFQGITDLAGKALLAETLPFATYEPKRVCPATQPSCVASFRSQPTPDSFKRIEDFTIVRKPETVQVNGVPVQKLVTTLVGVTQGTDALDLQGSELVTIDVTDPSNPVQRGSTHLGRRQQRITLLRDVAYKTRPVVNGQLTVPFAGDVALTTQFNNTLSMVNFVDVTDLSNPGGFQGGQFAGKVLIRFEQSGNLADQSAHGTYTGVGYAKGVAAIPHSKGYAAFVAAAEFGLMVVDLGQNTPEVFPADRQKEPMFPGDYTDVVAVESQVLAANRGERTLELFDLNLTPLAASDPLPDRPRRVVYAPGFEIDANEDGIISSDEVRNLAFVAGDSCGSESDPSGTCTASLQILDVTDLTAMKLIGRIPTPGAILDLDVDVVGKRAYAVGRRGPNANSGDVLLIIDLSNVSATGGVNNLIDNDGDANHWDDRIVWHKFYPDANVVRPAVPDQTYLYSVKFDRERGVAYVGTAWGVDIWPVKDNCCDVGVDLTAEHQDAPVGPKNELIRRERLAIEEGIRRGLVAATNDCATAPPLTSDPGPTPRPLSIADLLSDIDDRNRISILEQGSGACLWEGPQGSCDATYQPGLSDHDFEVFFPGFTAPNLRLGQTTLPPLVKCVIDTLNGQFTDSHREPRVISVDAGGQTFAMQFDDVTFFPVPKHEFEHARLNVFAPVSDSGTDATGDLGLGRQQLLLKWLLEGKYISIAGNGQNPGYIGPSGQNLLEGRPLNLILAELAQREMIPLLEGYEWARLQEFNLIKSKAYIRVKGASLRESAFHDMYVKQLHDAGKAGIRAAFARLASDSSTQIRILRITRSEYSGSGCFEVDAASQPEAWPRKPCTSFEEYITGAAISDYLIRHELQRGGPVNFLFDVPGLLQIHRFYRVKSDLEQIQSEADADAFIADVSRFIAQVQAITLGIYNATTPGDPSSLDRAYNLAQIDKKRDDALQNGSLHVVPRLFNVSFRDANDVELRMYRDVKGAGTVLAKNVRVTAQAGTEQFRRYEVGSLDPPQDDETTADRNEDDETRLAKPPKRREEFLLGDKKNPVVNPPVPLDASFGAEVGVIRFVSFTVDLVEKKLKESNRQNNFDGFFYYVLDRSTSTPALPASNPTPPLPLPNPAQVLLPDTECATPPKLTVFQSANNDQIRFSVTNTSGETLTAVKVCSNAAGACVLIGTIPANGSATATVSFTKPPSDATVESVATAYAIDSHGHGVALAFTDQLLNVASPISITMYDATPLADPNHPFSRFFPNHDRALNELPIHGATTDGTEKAVRVVIEGLKAGATADVSLAESGPLKTTQGLGGLSVGTATTTGLAVSVNADALGKAEVFYTPPSVFVRDAMRRYDFWLKEREVLLTVHQQDVGTKNAPIALARPPVFLVHGLFGTIHVWGCFQPLVPASSTVDSLGTKVSSFFSTLLAQGAEFLSVDPCAFDRQAEYFKPREGFDGRFDLFTVGMDNAVGKLDAGVADLKFEIHQSLESYKKGWAIGKVDLVGHSMGGVLSKKMTNEDLLARGGVRKIIALNSPFTGSEVADFVIGERDKLLPVKLNDNPVDLMAKPDVGDLWKVEVCNVVLRTSRLFTSKFNVFAGGLDDLRTTTQIPLITVPTHHITTTTTTNELSHSLEVKALWTLLGLCKATPDTNTIATTKKNNDITQIVLTLGSLGLASRVAAAELEESLVKVFKKTVAYQWDNDHDEPKPVFPTPNNDRVVSSASQLGGMTALEPSVTELFGPADHQSPKITPALKNEDCLSMNPDGTPKFFLGAITNGGAGFTACRVMELLEADPASKLFKKP